MGNHCVFLTSTTKQKNQGFQTFFFYSCEGANRKNQTANTTKLPQRLFPNIVALLHQQIIRSKSGNPEPPSMRKNPQNAKHTHTHTKHYSKTLKPKTTIRVAPTPFSSNLAFETLSGGRHAQPDIAREPEDQFLELVAVGVAPQEAVPEHLGRRNLHAQIVCGFSLLGGKENVVSVRRVRKI